MTLGEGGGDGTKMANLTVGPSLSHRLRSSSQEKVGQPFKSNKHTDTCTQTHIHTHPRPGPAAVSRVKDISSSFGVEEFFWIFNFWRKKNDVVPLSFSLEVCIFAGRSQMLIVKLFPGMMSSLSIDTHWPIAEQMHNPLKLCSTTLLIRWCQVLSQLNYFV